MEVHLPKDMLEHIHQELSWLHRKTTATEQDFLSLIGLLHQRLEDLNGTNIQYYCKVERANIFTRLNKDFCSGLYWWYTFIDLSILHNAKSLSQLTYTSRLMFQIFGCNGKVVSTNCNDHELCSIYGGLTSLGTSHCSSVTTLA